MKCFFLTFIKNSVMVVTDELINEYAEGAILLNGMETAIVGITQEFGNGPRVLYSTEKILEILTDGGMVDYEEALEYFHYNILGGYFGEQNPIFLSDHLWD
jgi:hypothetical protein